MSSIFQSMSNPGRAEVQRGVTVHDFITRQVALEWYESVAIVAELCAILTSHDASKSVPRAEDVLVNADGTLAVHGRIAAPPDVVDLSRMMNALLPGSAPPSPLRQFISKALTPGAYESLPAFGEALAYFERPGRAGIIATAYERFHETPSERVYAARGTLVAEAVAVAAPVPARRKRPIGPWLAVVAGLLVAATAIAVWISADGSARLTSPAVTGRFDTIIADARATTRNLEDSVREQLGFSPAVRPIRRQPVRPAAAAKPPVRRVVPPAAARAVAATEPAVQDAVAVPVVAASHAGARVASSAPPARAARLGPSEVVVAEPTDGSDVTLVDSTVYSLLSPDVQPPVLLTEHAMPSALRVVEPRIANAMELVVDATGTVERVRLLSTARRMADIMLLSAAKNWKFDPAMKAGEPVKYRISYTWVVALP